MKDDGLYERLHESEKRRRVAAILVDAYLNAALDFQKTDERKSVAIPVEVFQEWTNVLLHALGGDFEFVKSMVRGWPGMTERINFILGE